MSRRGTQHALTVSEVTPAPRGSICAARYFSNRITRKGLAFTHLPKGPLDQGPHGRDALERGEVHPPYLQGAQPTPSPGVIASCSHSFQAPMETFLKLLPRGGMHLKGRGLRGGPRGG